LKELYQHIPFVKKVDPQKDWKKIIRAFLRRLAGIVINEYPMLLEREKTDH
jgi:hypothetical protein